MPRTRTNKSQALEHIDVRDFSDKLRAAIEIRGDDECWPFIGITGKSSAIEKNRYGMISLGKKYDSFQVTAPRAALMMILGRDLRPGLVVIHLCHWKPCCNPRHLKEGTESENYWSNPPELLERLWAVDKTAPKKAGTGEKQRSAQFTSRMRHCECGYSVNAGTMAWHLRKTGHDLI